MGQGLEGSLGSSDGSVLSWAGLGWTVMSERGAGGRAGGMGGSAEPAESGGQKGERVSELGSVARAR